jgi:outer membrane protein assembly factor BamA
MIGRRLIGCRGARVGVPVCRSFRASARLVVAVAVAVMTVAASAAHARPAPDAPVPQAKTELGIVPIAGGNTDYGLGGGFLTNVAGLDPAVSPYVWRLEASAFISFKAKDAEPSDWINPYQDYYVLLTVPHFLHQRLRLELRPSYTRETTQLYYGLGNASVAPPDEIPGRDFYGRAHPTLSTRLRWELVGDLFVELGAAYTENWFELNPQSTLATDMTTGAPAVRELLGTATRHGVLLAENALIYDTRDSEIAPRQGQYHQIKIRYSPAAGGHLPYEYGQANATFRFYLPFSERVGLALRAVGDWQFGDVPFYELARYEDTFAFGGVNGVRGIPGQRYYGRIKLFSNVELRSRLFDFTLFRKPYALGGALFTDFGRLWSDFTGHPELDGSGLGLKYGLGGGVRLQQGKTFVIRLDVAWSPDARPLGAYLTAGHAF